MWKGNIPTRTSEQQREQEEEEERQRQRQRQEEEEEEAKEGVRAFAHRRLALTLATPSRS